MKIAVLHARQPLTTSLAEVFPEDDCAVLTPGDWTAAVREDVEGERPRTIRAVREDWPAALAAFGPDEVVTNDEYCLTDCARLRTGLGMAARHPAYLRRYLDKVAMKRELAAAGIRVPRVYAREPVVTGEQEWTILERVGLPAVAKPRQEANSRGVRIEDDQAIMRRCWRGAGRSARVVRCRVVESAAGR
jgi:biotin carboxylase